MTDQEFRELAEQWMKTRALAIEASRTYGALSAELQFFKLPRAVEHLEEATTAYARVDTLMESSRTAYSDSQALWQEVNKLDVQVRAILPPGIWYRVNGKGIMHQFGVATQIMDWEDVLEKVAQ